MPVAFAAADRLKQFERERANASAVAADHYGFTPKPWPWEPSLATQESSVATLHELANAIVFAAEHKCGGSITVQLGDERECDALQQLLPPDVFRRVVIEIRR